MCGIAGLWKQNGLPAEDSEVRRMIGMVRHRGPDDLRVLAEGPVALAHARLSIVDLAGGRQPMSNADGTLWITFNGEIFNYIELRQELLSKGFRFATQSDTEVILHCYEAKQERCVEDFEGQWSFAIWDAQRRRLFLSRDRMGILPLFYTTAGGAFLFASEMKALLAHPDVSRELDAAALDQIFTFWCTCPPRTVFQNIRELPPGHSLFVSPGCAEVRRYWQLNFADESEPFADSQEQEQQAADELLQTLTRATLLRLRADVPVAAYCSGGLDSSLIAALVRNHSNTSLHVFSISFDDAEYDESPYQQEVARHLGVQRSEIRCTAADIARAFPEVIWHTETPILRTAPVPLYLLAQFVRYHGYKVVLTGEGADEMFGGYDIFKEAKVRRFWAAQPRSHLRPLLLRRLYPYLPNLQMQSPEYLQAFFRIGPEDAGNPFFSHLPRWQLASQLKRFFSEDTKARLTAEDACAEMEAELPINYRTWQTFCQAQYLESRYLLPGYLLSSQGDRMAMANGVETRFPFLDSQVVQLAGRIPPHLKMKVLNEKYILKRCSAGLVPAMVRARHKQPYRAPDGDSFFNDSGEAPEYVEFLLSPQEIRRSGLFQPIAVQNLVSKFRRKQAIGFKDNMALVGILSTQLLVHQFIDRLELYRERATAAIHYH